MPHIPPIAALRALDAAARHLSFTKAADELNVTQSAVSHQIRHMEELWGVKLFERRGRRLELTQAGRQLSAVAREFFTRLQDTLDSLSSSTGHTALRIEMLPTFAVKWLVPRLQSFHGDHPDIDVWISTSMNPNRHLDDGALDAAIELSHGDYGAGIDAWRMLREYAFPIARPRFLEQHGTPESPADLVRYPLILRHHEIGVPGWEQWFRRAGVPEEVYLPALKEGTRFPDTNTALQAAYEGQGIALGRTALVWDDLKQGRFVRLFDVICPFDMSYYFVCPHDRTDRPAVKAFREWLLAEAERAQAEYDQGRPRDVEKRGQGKRSERRQGAA